MPNQMIRRMSAICAISALACPAALADETFNWSFEASAGSGFDSNVGIAELDPATGEGDAALLLGAKAGLEFKPVKRLKLNAGYDYSGTFYDEYDQFNLETHLGSLGAEYDFEILSAGVLYNHVDARLDGDSYLTYEMASPYVSKLFADKVFVRAAYEAAEKSYDTNQFRDADAEAVRVDGYYFLQGRDKVVSVTGKVTEEDAVSDAFDYDGFQTKARYTQRFNMFGKASKARIGAEYEQRDYAGVTPQIGTSRDDTVFAAVSQLEVDLFGPVAMQVDYSYRNRDSNLPAADYDEHIGELRFKAAF